MRSRVHRTDWDEGQQNQLRRLQSRGDIFVTDKLSLTEALGRARARNTTITLAEGVNYIYEDVTVVPDDIVVRALSWNSTVETVGGAQIIWSGDRGKFHTLHLSGPGAADPRATNYLLKVTGADFSTWEVRYTDSTLLLDLQGDYAHCYSCRFEDQTIRAINNTGDYSWIVGNQINNGAGTDLLSSGAKCYVAGNRAIGGVITVSGGGSYNNNIV